MIGSHRTLLLTCAPAFIVALDNLVVSTSLTSIHRDLGSSAARLTSAANGTFREAGGAISVALATVVSAARGGYGSQATVANGVIAALVLAAALSIGGAFVGARAPRLPRVSRTTADVIAR